MKSIATVFLLIGLAFGGEIPEEDGVMVLTNDIFDEALELNPNTLVEFYAPWCGHCKALAPEFAAAAQKLKDKNSSIRLAKVDATVETELATKYKVTGYPTLKFFKDGKMLEYGGGRTSDTIVSWLEKRVGPPAVTLTSVDQTRSLIDSSDVVVIGFFTNLSTPGYKAFEASASATDNVIFGVTSDKSIFNEYQVIASENIVLFKKFDEGRNDFSGSLDEKEIQEFIVKYQMPVVIEFTQESAQKIFSGSVKKHSLAFVSKKADNFSELKKIFEAVAKKYLGKVIFITVDSDVEDNQRVMEFFGMNPQDIPSFRVIYLDEEMVKYKPEDSSFSQENIDTFVRSVLDGRVKPHLLSEEVPDDWNSQPVKVLVGKNYNEVVHDKSKSVFVELYAPWCGHCKQLAPIWEELAETYKDKADLVVAKMDATKNEVDGIKVQSFPTLKYYPKDSDEVIEYNAERNLESFQKFLDSDGKEGGKAEVAEEDADEETEAEAGAEHKTKEEL